MLLFQFFNWHYFRLWFLTNTAATTPNIILNILAQRSRRNTNTPSPHLHFDLPDFLVKFIIASVAVRWLISVLVLLLLLRGKVLLVVRQAVLQCCRLHRLSLRQIILQQLFIVIAWSHPIWVRILLDSTFSHWSTLTQIWLVFFTVCDSSCSSFCQLTVLSNSQHRCDF